MRDMRMEQGQGNQKRNRFPLHGYAGVILVLISWGLNWGLTGLRTHLLFFPLWLGYALTMDGIVFSRKGTSLFSSDKLRYAGLFLLSVPVWWLFEGLNHFTRNWIYLGREQFSGLEYFFYSSLSFSTVIPAVFSTAELLGTTGWLRQLDGIARFPTGRGIFLSLHFGGWVMLLLMVVFPEIFFPFMWLSVFFIIDPVNAIRGRPSLIRMAGSGRWSKLAQFGLAALVCGFFWELWNIYSYPKWIYDIPYLEFWHIFEMPLAGYGGYIPFGWELFALYAMVVSASPGQDLFSST